MTTPFQHIQIISVPLHLLSMRIKMVLVIRSECHAKNGNDDWVES